MGQEKIWLRPLRVARRLDCTREHVYNLVQTGELEAIKVGPRALRISEDSLQRFIAKNRIDPSEKN